ncbi:MAG: hypothetical protein ACREUN_12145 [Burkholderiales bacterium]
MPEVPPALAPPIEVPPGFVLLDPDPPIVLPVLPVPEAPCLAQRSRCSPIMPTHRLGTVVDPAAPEPSVLLLPVVLLPLPTLGAPPVPEVPPAVPPAFEPPIDVPPGLVLLEPPVVCANVTPATPTSAAATAAVMVFNIMMFSFRKK